MIPRRLTQREWEVVFLVRQGHGYKQIAHRLDISWRTVEKHVLAVARSLGDGCSPLATVRLHADTLIASRPPVVTPDDDAA